MRHPIHKSTNFIIVDIELILNIAGFLQLYKGDKTKVAYIMVANSPKKT